VYHWAEGFLTVIDVEETLSPSILIGNPDTFFIVILLVIGFPFIAFSIIIERIRSTDPLNYFIHFRDYFYVNVL
jgi:hypothetical protein